MLTWARTQHISSVLEISQLQAWYSNIQVLFDVSLDVNAGEVVSLMGRNGMGKSTTINSVCGLLDNRQGSVSFHDQAIIKLPSYKIARRGIGLVPEGRRIFANLTVLENLKASASRGAWTLAGVFQLFPRLEERAAQSAATLSGGEQQMLAIGRALMTNPSLLILDEATEGLAPLIRKEIWGAIRALKTQGMCILLVDKSLKELKSIADRCYMLDRGRTVWTGTPIELTDQIAQRYLGI